MTCATWNGRGTKCTCTFHCTGCNRYSEEKECCSCCISSDDEANV